MHLKSENGVCEEQKKSEIILKSELTHPWATRVKPKRGKCFNKFASWNEEEVLMLKSTSSSSLWMVVISLQNNAVYCSFVCINVNWGSPFFVSRMLFTCMWCSYHGAPCSYIATQFTGEKEISPWSYMISHTDNNNNIGCSLILLTPSVLCQSKLLQYWPHFLGADEKGLS